MSARKRRDQSGKQTSEESQAESSDKPSDKRAQKQLDNRAEKGIPSFVIRKLIFFSILMFGVPLSLFYFGLEPLFNGSLTQAGIAAAVAANVVLIGFVVSAFMED